MTPYGDRKLGQHWHQAITWTNVDLSSVRSRDILLRAISQQVSQPSITVFGLKSTPSKSSLKSPRPQWVNSKKLDITHITVMTNVKLRSDYEFMKDTHISPLLNQFTWKYIFIKHILSVTPYRICGAVCFQFTHFLCDDWVNTYTLSFYNHQIGSMSQLLPIARVRSWNNGMHCMSFYILKDRCLEYFLQNFPQVNATRPQWWLVNTGLRNGLLPGGKKPLPEPIFTQFYLPYGITRPQWVNAHMQIFAG